MAIKPIPLLHSKLRDVGTITGKAHKSARARAPAQLVANDSMDLLACDGVGINAWNDDNSVFSFGVKNTNSLDLLIPGIYAITGKVVFPFNATGVRGMMIETGPTPSELLSEVESPFPNTFSVVIHRVIMVKVTLAAGIWVQLSAYQTSGIGLTTGISLLTAYLLQPA